LGKAKTISVSAITEYRHLF